MGVYEAYSVHRFVPGLHGVIGFFYLEVHGT